MKIYQSPLSIVGVLFVLVGVYLIWSMFRGLYPSYFLFLFLPIGIIMLVGDYFLRKSGLALSTKLIIQTLCGIAPIVFAFLYFTGKIR